MDATIVNSTDGLVSVRVIDRDGYTHFVGLSPTGDFVEHTSDDLPNPDEYTDDIRKRIERVVKYARYIFSRRYPARDVIAPTDDPAVLRRALRVLESMRDKQFEVEYDEYRTAMVSPSPDDWEYGENFTPEQVALVYQPLYFDGAMGLVTQGERPRYICVDEGETTFVGDDISAPVVIKHEPLRLQVGLTDNVDDVDSGEDVREINPNDVDMGVFRDFVREQLEAQIRECYIKMGCTPPQEFAQDSFGRI
jgi:hypothetical protein